MLAEVLAGLATTAILLLSAAVRPTQAACPPGWYLAEGIRTQDGIRPRGTFGCQRPLLGLENDAPAQPGIVRGRLYCATPRVVDDRRVRCD